MYTTQLMILENELYTLVIQNRVRVNSSDNNEDKAVT
jgi:hypothetical protein